VAHNLDWFVTQYPTSCMLHSSGLIGCVYKMMRMMREGSLPHLIDSGRHGYKSVCEESTSHVQL
jgi:hypothetical protein